MNAQIRNLNTNACLRLHFAHTVSSGYSICLYLPSTYAFRNSIPTQCTQECFIRVWEATAIFSLKRNCDEKAGAGKDNRDSDHAYDLDFWGKLFRLPKLARNRILQILQSDVHLTSDSMNTGDISLRIKWNGCEYVYPSPFLLRLRLSEIILRFDFIPSRHA